MISSLQNNSIESIQIFKEIIQYCWDSINRQFKKHNIVDLDYEVILTEFHNFGLANLNSLEFFFL